jgi:lipopolysaccharide/colanic/teichoic acid biosynthesis glycosyltransferase
LAIKLSNPRAPAIFRQQRAGRGGVPFTFFKLRTMQPDAEARKAGLMHLNEAELPVFKMRDDPRVTRLGRLLRKASLDEVPQLWNVLVGDMSLVGPRPPTLDEVAQYEPWQRRRLDCVGGITGEWQVSGRAGIPFAQWVRMDARYARSHSLSRDLGLLARTVKAVLTRRGAA